PVQPMILPLFGGLTQIEVIARLAGDAKAEPYALVLETIGALSGGGEKAMRRFLHDGVLAGSALAKTTVRYNLPAVQQSFTGAPAKPAAALGLNNLEVRFVADHTMD